MDSRSRLAELAMQRTVREEMLRRATRAWGEPALRETWRASIGRCCLRFVRGMVRALALSLCLVSF
jgi:hypothetical protein